MWGYTEVEETSMVFGEKKKTQLAKLLAWPCRNMTIPGGSLALLK